MQKWQLQGCLPHPITISVPEINLLHFMVNDITQESLKLGILLGNYERMGYLGDHFSYIDILQKSTYKVSLERS